MKNKIVESTTEPSLRDFFAGQFLAGVATTLLASTKEGRSSVAVRAYAMADTMLKQRELP